MAPETRAFGQVGITKPIARGLSSSTNFHEHFQYKGRKAELKQLCVENTQQFEGVVAKVFTSKSGNTFLNIGYAYPNQTFTG